LTAVCTGVLSASSIRSISATIGNPKDGARFHAYLSDAALAVRRCADALLAAEPGNDGVIVERRAAREVFAKALLDQLPCERRRTRTGARVDDFAVDLEGELALVHHAGDSQWIGLPAAVVALQCRTPHEVVEGNPHHRPIRQLGVRLEEIAQQPAYRARRQRFCRQVFVDVQVEPRHVYATHIGLGQVHIRRNTRRRTHGAAVGSGQRHRHVDVAHADPFERAGNRRLRLVGDIGHRAYDILVVVHGIS
jgi:hypothetical protein